MQIFYSNSSLIVRESLKESLLVTNSRSLIGLLLYYDAVLSLKRSVMIAVKFYCNQSTGGEGAELSCGGAKYWGGGSAPRAPLTLTTGPSVCPSDTYVDCDKTEERSVSIFIPHERSHGLVFWGEWLVGERPFYLKFLAKRPSLERNRLFSVDIRSSEVSSITTNSKTTSRFPMSPRWTSYVAPRPPWGLKTAEMGVFQVKSHFTWIESAMKFLLWILPATKFVRHSLLSIREKSVCGGRPPLRENLPETDPQLSTDFRS